MPDPVPEAEDTVKVKGTLADNKIALAEVNPRHPGGEAVVIGSTTVTVAPTQRVMQAVNAGKLKLV